MSKIDETEVHLTNMLKMMGFSMPPPPQGWIAFGADIVDVFRDAKLGRMLRKLFETHDAYIGWEDYRGGGKIAVGWEDAEGWGIRGVGDTPYEALLDAGVKP